MKLTEAEGDILREHLPYEFDMLSHAYNRLMNPTGDTVQNNAFIESFAVHARCLVNFFKPIACSRYVTDDYVAFRQQRPNDATMRKINDQILSLTWARTSDQAEKFGPDDWREIYFTLLLAMEEFQNHLKS